jgi:AraC-like DNA-binding protein
MTGTPHIPLNDLDHFYKSFIKKQVLTTEDLDARVKLPQITSYFRIHRTEYAIRLIGQELPPNRYNFYFLSLVRQGTATKTNGLSTFLIKPHTLWSTPLGQIHSAKDWTADATGYYISFSPDFFPGDPAIGRLVQQIPFFKFDGQHYLYLNEPTSDELYDLFGKMEREFERNDPWSESLIRVHLTEILLKAQRLFEAETGRRTQSEHALLSEKYKGLIEKHYLKEKSVVFYADHLAVHPNHLNSVCKKETGFTASDLIKERVLQEAKYLLYQSGLSIKEIAWYLQFEDASYFSRFFKKATGLTPVEYGHTYRTPVSPP